MYAITYNHHVAKDLKQLGASEKKQIKSAIEHKLVVDPLRYGKPLQYSLAPTRSMRVGPYRVVFEIQDTAIYVWLIAHRKHVYDIAQKRLA